MHRQIKKIPKLFAIWYRRSSIPLSRTNTGTQRDVFSSAWTHLFHRTAPARSGLDDVFDPDGSVRNAGFVLARSHRPADAALCSGIGNCVAHRHGPSCWSHCHPGHWTAIRPLGRNDPRRNPFNPQHLPHPEKHDGSAELPRALRTKYGGRVSVPSRWALGARLRHGLTAGGTTDRPDG